MCQPRCEPPVPIRRHRLLEYDVTVSDSLTLDLEHDGITQRHHLADVWPHACIPASCHLDALETPDHLIRASVT